MKLATAILMSMSAITAAPSYAAVLMDQIGSTTRFTRYRESQDVEPALTSQDVGAVDDFTLTGAYRLTSVEAVVMPAMNPTNLDAITGYRVEIYSSRAAAGNSLTGNIYSTLIAPSAAAVTPLLGTARLVSLNIDTSIGAGTYFLSVIPVLNYRPYGQSAIALNGAGNSFAANPGKGFGYPDTTFENFGLAAAYRVNGDAAATVVPEPATWGMMMLGFGAVGAAMRRRRQRPYAI